MTDEQTENEQAEPETPEPESEEEAPNDTAEHHVGELLKDKAGDLDTKGRLSEVFDQDRVEWPEGRDLDHEPTGHTAETTPTEEAT